MVKAKRTGEGVGVWAFLLLLCLCPNAEGGVVVRKDGSTLHGDIISETDKEVVVSVNRNGMTVKVTLKREEVMSVDKNAPTVALSPAPATGFGSTAGAGGSAGTTQPVVRAAVPSYYPITVAGTIGAEVTARALETALNDARRYKADYVVLVMNTPGGSIDEMGRIVDLLNGSKDLTLIAFVRQAISAGAVITVSCPKIVMAEGGTIGGAVPYAKTPGGLDAVSEKFSSIFRARSRATAERNGHSPLLIDGMIEPSLVLSLIKEHGKPRIVEGEPEKGRLIKPQGKILTLTAAEATDYGLSVGSSPSVESIRLAIGAGEWRRVGGRDVATISRPSYDERREAAYREAKANRERQAGETRERLVPQIATLEQQLADVRSRGRAAQDTLASLGAENSGEILRVNRECDAALRQIHPNDPAGRSLATRARETRNRQLAEIQARYQPQFARVEERINELAREQQKLVAALKPLVEELRKAEAR